MVISIYTGCCLLGLRFAHAHTSRWSRAGLHDFVEAAAWLICGMFLSGGLVSVFLEDLSYRMILVHLTALGFSLIGVAGARCLSQTLQEGIIDSMHRRRRVGAKKSRITLLYGAGDTGELFLTHLRLSPSSKWSEFSFLGFIDDQGWLRGRRLRGFRIFGGRECLDALVKSHQVECIVVTTGKMDVASRAGLIELCERLGIELLEWSPGLDLLSMAWDQAADSKPGATTPDGPACG